MDVLPLGLSDHAMVLINRKINSHYKVLFGVSKIRNFKKFNEECFITDLKNMPWYVVEERNDIDEAYHVWELMFNTVCDKHAPLQQIRRRATHMAPWVTKEMLELSRKRDSLRSKAQKSGNQDDWLHTKCIRNKVNNLAKHLKKTYYANLISEKSKDPREMWKVTKEAISAKKSYTLPLTTDKQNMADDFNNFFVNIGADLARNVEEQNTSAEDGERSHSRPCIDVKVENSLKFMLVPRSFVSKQINSMKSSKATGLDGISCRLLKAASSAIITPLTNLINRSLATGTVPTKWKMAKVTPIFKSGERDDVTNYRPISVLPLVSKIIERAVHDQLHTFLKGKGYLADQ